MKIYKFTVEIIKDDLRTGLKKGTKWNPKGFYYQKKNVIIVGMGNDTVRLALPIDNVKVTIK